MNSLPQEIRRFQTRSARSYRHAAAMVSLRLLCGEDLDKAIGGPKDERRRITAKLSRLLERERIRGLRGHWSYDLNRHIALRQALDLITESAR